ncbi:MAG: gliding motility lipoprotein GldJ [Cytophagales bacterium]|nr:MAG: gliding motility lipoprotein GldJ [Cytophagales bacterium]TAH31182.1 MAG: gliding motility lipoprotein GldJ [Cytophagales bacterium]
MLKRKVLAKYIPSLFIAGVLLAACSKGGNPTSSMPGAVSKTTGLPYNDEDSSFKVEPYAGQPEGPNLVFIEGGRTILGSFEEDVMNTRDNVERTVTITSFFMDETEIANIHWLEYLYYISKDSGGTSSVAYTKNLPDTTVWKQALSYNDPYVDHYFRYPGFRYYPVVGVSWNQAYGYTKWRTSVVNMQLAKSAQREDLVEISKSGGRIPLESGLVLPDYRLPSEAEWEYAAKALVGTQWLDENQTHARLYPWDGHALRNPYGNQMGTFLANFKRGRGDYAGIAGKLNDGAMITEYIYAFPPNDYGLYNMAGNVNEWCADLYRSNSYQDFDDLNSFRRDGVFDKKDNYDKKNWISLIDDSVRVYKGGSWKDVAYWLAPGTRRFLDQDSSTSSIGFRCAMIRAGTNN